MKTENKTQGNKRIAEKLLIAEFMGWSIHPKYGSQYLINLDKNRVLPPYYSDINDQGRLSDFNYHTSWDWLMPVVEKIRTHGCVIDLRLDKDMVCVITKVNKIALNHQILKESNSAIESVYQAVLEFINWYNLNPTLN